LYYDPDYESTIIEEDMEIVENHFKFPDEDDTDKVSSWMLRMIIDRN
jgi:DNA-directed RNA polymerase II subunit RPB1